MSDLASYNDLENAVLNAVAAIHCLSVERNNLRHHVEAYDNQIGSLRDANEHLRRQIVLIDDSYKAYAASRQLAGKRRIGDACRRTQR